MARSSSAASSLTPGGPIDRPRRLAHVVQAPGRRHFAVKLLRLRGGHPARLRPLHETRSLKPRLVHVPEGLQVHAQPRRKRLPAHRPPPGHKRLHRGLFHPVEAVLVDPQPLGRLAHVGQIDP